MSRKINDNINIILTEIASVLNSIDQKEVETLMQEILTAKQIVLLGSGRVGFTCKAFAMRLSHLGLDSYFLGDSNTPSVTKGDLIIVASGSGETQTIYDLTKIAKTNKSRVVLITASPKSRIAKLSDNIVLIKAPTKYNQKPKSIQPMTTLNEQCLTIFFDAIILMLMKKLKINHHSMQKRHSNLE